VCACAAAAAVAPVDAGGGDLPRCHTAQLRLRDDGGQGAAGTGILSLSLRNAGRRCRTQGFPGVRFLDAHRRTITVRQVRGAATGPRRPRRVVLRHGAYAHVIVSAPNATADGRPCRRARYVRVIAPDETTARTARVRHAPGCVRVIRISPVVQGRDRIG
jgi:hypothetical protein